MSSERTEVRIIYVLTFVPSQPRRDVPLRARETTQLHVLKTNANLL